MFLQKADNTGAVRFATDSDTPNFDTLPGSSMYETAAEPPSFQDQVVTLPPKDASPVLTEIRKDIKVWCMQLCYRRFFNKSRCFKY